MKPLTLFLAYFFRSPLFLRFGLGMRPELAVLIALVPIAVLQWVRVKQTMKLSPWDSPDCSKNSLK